ncbi:MAG: universal stress protein [Betaproteobacteria bacterium]|nr:universal stress protein [Betaproteobacteria bacterium]
MYSRILLPTNGSELCDAANEEGIRFAKSMNATIVAFHAIPASFYVAFTEFGPAEPLQDQLEKDAQLRGDNLVAEIAERCQASAVACETLTLVNDHAWEAIIEAAHTKRCDLIFMASHGRRGLSALLLGSETMKVLTHTKVPVLVYR